MKKNRDLSFYGSLKFDAIPKLPAARKPWWKFWGNTYKQYETIFTKYIDRMYCIQAICTVEKLLTPDEELLLQKAINKMIAVDQRTRGMFEGNPIWYEEAFQNRMIRPIVVGAIFDAEDICKKICGASPQITDVRISRAARSRVITIDYKTSNKERRSMFALPKPKE